jgi:hypothetical protein
MSEQNPEEKTPYVSPIEKYRVRHSYDTDKEKNLISLEFRIRGDKSGPYEVAVPMPEKICIGDIAVQLVGEITHHHAELGIKDYEEVKRIREELSRVLLTSHKESNPPWEPPSLEW